MTLLLIRRSVDDGPREGGRPISQLRTESNGGENDSGVFEISRHALLGQEGSAANAARGEVTLGKPLRLRLWNPRSRHLRWRCPPDSGGRDAWL